jgi:signal transduction histidine kinase
MWYRLTQASKTLSLRTKLLGLVLALVALPLISVDLIVLNLFKQSSLEQAANQLQRTAETYDNLLSSTVERQRRRIREMASQPQLRELLLQRADGETVDDGIKDWADEQLDPLAIPDFNKQDYFNFDLDLIEITATQKEDYKVIVNTDQIGYEKPKPLLLPQSTILDGLDSSLVVDPGFILCTSIRIIAGSRQLGVLTVGNNLDNQNMRLCSRMTGASLAIVHQGGVYANSSDSFDFHKWTVERLSRLQAELKFEEDERTVSGGIHQVGEKKYRLLLHPLSIQGKSGRGVLVLGIETKPIDDRIKEVQRAIFLITLVSALISMLFATKLINRVVLAPLGALLRGTQRVAEGNLEHRIPYGSEDEIGGLARDFNIMTQRLQELYNTLEQLVHDRTAALRQSLAEAEEAQRELERRDILTRAYSEFLSLLNTNDLEMLEKSGLRTLVNHGDAGLGLLMLRRENRSSLRVRVLKDATLKPLIQPLTRTGGMMDKAFDSKGMFQEKLTDSYLANHELVKGTDLWALSFPLRVRDHDLGSLLLITPSQTSHDISVFLNNASRQFSVALSNAAAVEQIKQQSMQLERINLELQRADKMKSEFLASMSHELRTPMNAILGFSQVLVGGMLGELNKEQKDTISRVHKCGSDLLALINSILDLSQIEAGKMKLNLESVSIAQVVHGALATVEPLLSDKSLELESSIAENMPVILADPAKLDQIMINLLGNAIKFTQSGKISISVRARQIDGFYIPEGWVGLSVRDSGIGIPSERQKEIFDRFTQVDGSDSKMYRGTGLGLSITRKLVELHGGMISVTSTPGRGSVFTVALPSHPPY